MFIASKIAGLVLSPLGIVVLLSLGGLAALAGRDRLRARNRAIGLFIASFASLWVFSTEGFADFVAGGIERRVPSLPAPAALDRKAYEDVSRIVVLGGGLVRNSPSEGGAASLRDSGATRLAYGLRLARALDKNLLFSGGDAESARGSSAPKKGGKPLPALAASTEAETAAGWAREAGFDPARIETENASLNTAENARNVAALLRSKGDLSADKRGRIILVTSALHMPRALREFKRQGIEAIPAPCDYRVTPGADMLPPFLPRAAYLGLSDSALHELLGSLFAALSPGKKVSGSVSGGR